MKTRILLIATLSLAVSLCSIHAQTNAAPEPPTNPLQFVQQAGSWLSSFDANKTWSNTPADLWTAMNYQSSVNTSAEIGGSYDIWYPTAKLALAPELVFRNAGVSGTIQSGAGGLGLSALYFDLKLTGYVDGGYNPSLSCGFVEVGARMKKKMTTSTYAMFSISWDANFTKRVANQTAPTITAGLGWCF